MIEMPQQKAEMFAEHEDEIAEIREICSDLIDKAMESETPYNPAVRFKTFLQEKFTSLGIETPVEDFAAYHYAVGSSPKETQTEFDTEDGLILQSLKDFVSI